MRGLRMIARFLSLVAALLCADAVDVQLANADTASAPFTLDYSVTPVGPNYQYNFSLVLDNNDGSWVPGQEFNWLIVGAAVNQPSPFAELDSFFTSIPANSYATSTSGFFKRPHFVLRDELRRPIQRLPTHCVGRDA
jgi:hypothetical protein